MQFNICAGEKAKVDFMKIRKYIMRVITIGILMAMLADLSAISVFAENGNPTDIGSNFDNGMPDNFITMSTTRKLSRRSNTDAPGTYYWHNGTPALCGQVGSWEYAPIKVIVKPNTQYKITMDVSTNNGGSFYVYYSSDWNTSTNKPASGSNNMYIEGNYSDTDKSLISNAEAKTVYTVEAYVQTGEAQTSMYLAVRDGASKNHYFCVDNVSIIDTTPPEEPIDEDGDIGSNFDEGLPKNFTTMTTARKLERRLNTDAPGTYYCHNGTPALCGQVGAWEYAPIKIAVKPNTKYNITMDVSTNQGGSFYVYYCSDWDTASNKPASGSNNMYIDGNYSDTDKSLISNADAQTVYNVNACVQTGETQTCMYLAVRDAANKVQSFCVDNLSIIRLAPDVPVDEDGDIGSNFDEGMPENFATMTTARKLLYRLNTDAPGTYYWHNSTPALCGQVGAWEYAPVKITVKPNTKYYMSMDVSTNEGGSFYIYYCSDWDTASNKPANGSNNMYTSGNYSAGEMDKSLIYDAGAQTIYNVNAYVQTGANQTSMYIALRDAANKSQSFYLDNISIYALPDNYGQSDARGIFNEYGDTQKVKTFIDRYKFNVTWAKNLDLNCGGATNFSGWIGENAGGSISNSGAALVLEDTDVNLPVSMKKEFETVKNGTLTLEFMARFSNTSGGYSVKLDSLNGTDITLTADNSQLSLSAGAKHASLGSFSSSTWYAVRISVDLDNNCVSAYLNGTEAAKLENLELTNIENLIISTGNRQTGRMEVKSISLYKGFYLREYFSAQNSTRIGEPWTATNTVCQYSPANSETDNYHMLLRNSSGAAKASAKVVGYDNSTDSILQFECFAADNKINTAVSVKGDKETELCRISGGNIMVGGNSVYKLTSNLWHTFRIKIMPNYKKAALYVNGRLVTDNISVDEKNITNVIFSAESSSTQVKYDGILFYRDEPYVAPVVESIPSKRKSSVALGMQACPIWREGTHVGWDTVGCYNERIPYLGYYDEGSPEVSDWEIKWMAEHGIDFQWYCWYRPGDGTATGSTGEPLKSQNGALDDGFFYAKNKDKMKFAIMYENASSSYGSLDDFKNNIVPYWIEYYLKNPRYYTIDNRPLIGVYDMWSFCRPNKESASNISDALNYLTAECKKIGLGEPIYVAEIKDATTINDNEAFNNFGYAAKHYGFDYIYPYNTDSYNLEAEKKFIDKMGKTQLNIATMATVCTGFNSKPWGKDYENINYGILTPDDFGKMCTWIRDSFSSNVKVSGLSKTPIMIDTWNEFGEGTFISPSNSYGFAYLDKIRDVFTTGGTHSDAAPSLTEKDRFNNLYPYLGVNKKAKKKYESVKTENERSIIESTCVSNENISSFSQSASGISGNISGEAPRFTLSCNEDISDAAYLKLKIKTNSTSNSGKIRFATDKAASSKYTECKFVYNGNLGEYQTVYIPLYSNKLWDGTLTQLEIYPAVANKMGLTGSTTYNFSIAEIDLVKTAVPEADKRYMYYDDCVYDITEDSVVSDNNLYIKAKLVKDLLDEACYVDSATGKAYFSRYGYSSLTADTVSFNGNAYIKADALSDYKYNNTEKNKFSSVTASPNQLVLYTSGYNTYASNQKEISDFESGTDGWSAYGSATVSRLTNAEDVIYGNASFQVNVNKDRSMQDGIEKTISVEPGKKYMVCCKVRMPQCSDSAKTVSLKVLNGSSAIAERVEYMSAGNTLGGLCAEFTAPANTRSLKIRIVGVRNSSATLLFDNVTLYELENIEFGGIKVYDNNSRVYDRTLPHSDLTFKLDEICNYGDEEKNITFFVAEYDGDKLVGIHSAVRDIGGGNISKDIFVSSDINEASEKIKLFIWDKSLKPLTGKEQYDVQ